MDLVDRGARLFEYLARAQDIGMTRIPDVADLGSVIWLSDLPIHRSVRFEPEAAGSPFLVVGKVRVEPVVALTDPELRAWLASAKIDDPENEPELRQMRPGAQQVLKLSNHPEVVDRFKVWIAQWRLWAAKARRDLLAQRLYRNLYDIYTELSASSETTQAVLGLGCLTWKLPRNAAVRRHVLTAPVKIEFDTDSGDLSVTAEVSNTGFSVELMDFLETTQLSAPALLREAEDSARDDGIDPFDRPAVGRLVRRLIHCIDPDAAYVDEMTAAPATAEPRGAYAPALILRPRGRRGLVRVLGSIARRIRQQREVPEGIRNLVDPDYQPVRVAATDDGAIVRDGADSFLPLQLNEVQLRILDHVDTSAHTIVQGPPGTGKTHTAAALITHLLAQGKRVLVTAHTDRALEEVRGKLRDEIKPLCVAVVGTSRDSFTDLEVAVERISEAAADHDPARSARTTQAAQRRIDDLRRKRADLMQRLLHARESEVTRYEIAGYTGTLTDIVLRHRAEAERLGWISELAAPRVDEPLPVAAEEVGQWRTLLLDENLQDPEASAPDLITAAELPPPAEVERLFALRAQATERCRGYQDIGNSEWVRRVVELAPSTRSELFTVVRGQDQTADDLADSREPWISDAVLDVRAGRASEWHARAERIAELLAPAEQSSAAVGITEVTVDGADRGRLVALAEALLAHIAKSGEIKVRSDGSPKTGLTAPRVVKDAAALFESVRVDGRIPISPEQLEKVRQFDQVTRMLNQLDGVWQGILQPPAAGSLPGRLAWHRERHARLQSVMQFGAQLMAVGQKLREHGVPEPDWADARSVRTLLDAFDAVAAMDELRASEEPISGLRERLRVLRNDPRATANLRDMYGAVERGDLPAYHAGFARLNELHELRRKYKWRNALGARMAALPLLRDAIAAAPHHSPWQQRLADLPEAWSWAAVGRWLTERADEQVNDLFRELDQIESGLRDEATTLAVTRAWDRAVGPGRLTQTSRSDLRQYVQLVRKLGKGSGIHAARRRSDIKQTMARCRSAVPVWIMPIYRVVEQLDIEQDMFDVVVVDEASQAGLESVFLQYLAPRIVVIGDDKQVSPAGVGVDQRQLRTLASRYLPDDRFRASWEEPKRSLFDEATMRFSARLTLVEHRRCVPEIIGFSNKIAYEPQNVRLIPVRLYGTDRLPPIRTVHVAEGASKANNTNEAEADRIVAQIADCIDDPRYEGKTFGVISLLGAAQAKLIWDKLLLRFQPEELARRQLRCGDAADFQGAERDVIFLSMVKASGPDSRLVAQTSEQIVQRYNVAVSRARDQLWLFHSVTLEELRNSADMRFQLLDYCLGIQRPISDTGMGRPVRVPDDRLVAPFESLFEQQVFNRIVDRGYRVSAHYDAMGFDIDMVVAGEHARVAIQCDGDQWDGPEEFHRDLARQRDLERCGWPFFRIRQSQFVANPEASLEPLWKLFEELLLQPIAEEEPPVLGETVSGATALLRPVPDRRVRPAGQEEASPDVTAEPITDTAETDESVSDVAFKPVPGTAPSGRAEPSAVSADVPTTNVEPEVRWRQPEATAATDVDSGSAASNPETSSSPESDSVAPRGTGSRTTADYRGFSELVTSPEKASLTTVIDDLVRIVQVEGPVSGARLHAAYIDAAGGADREGTRDIIERALRTAVATAELLDDDPLGLGNPAWRTYRTPEQPVSSWRTLGVRRVDQVPARELAEIMAYCADRVGWEDRAALMRAVLKEIDQTQLSDHAIAALALVLPLSRRLASDPASAGS